MYWILALLACALMASPPPAQAQKKLRPLALDELSSSLQELVARVNPAVVQIFTTGYVPRSLVSNAGLLGEEHGSGSG